MEDLELMQIGVVMTPPHPPEEKVVFCCCFNSSSSGMRSDGMIKFSRWPKELARAVADVLGDSAVWRAAITEFVATGLLTFLTAGGGIASLQAGFTSPFAAIALLTFIVLSFMILCAIPASGGHINPCITLATMLAGHTSIATTVCYIIAQSFGATVGASILKLIVPKNLANKYALCGCILQQYFPQPDGTILESGISIRAGFIAEIVFSFAFLYIAFSIALDPKQGKVTGFLLAPFLIGATIGIFVFISGQLIDKQGYSGAGMNPARCFGIAMAMGEPIIWKGHWVFWVGPFVASFAIALLYRLIPPHHVELYRTKQDVITRVKSVIRVKSINSRSSSRRGSERILKGVI